LISDSLKFLLRINAMDLHIEKFTFRIILILELL
jgi:hypothetical protein